MQTKQCCPLNSRIFVFPAKKMKADIHKQWIAKCGPPSEKCAPQEQRISEKKQTPKKVKTFRFDEKIQ